MKEFTTVFDDPTEADAIVEAHRKMAVVSFGPDAQLLGKNTGSMPFADGDGRPTGKLRYHLTSMWIPPQAATA